MLSHGIWIAIASILIEGLPSSVCFAETTEKNKLVLLFPVQERDANFLTPAVDILSRSKQYQVVYFQALIPLMRQIDVQKNVRPLVESHLEQGQKSLILLDHKKAWAELTAAMGVLENSYLRYYDPTIYSQVRLLLGITSLQMAKPEIARRMFIAIHQNDPSFKLDAHYSPQIRAAFDAALPIAASPELPNAKDLARLVGLANARAALVFSVDPVGEATLFKGAFYLGEKASYIAVESKLYHRSNPEAAKRQAEELGGYFYQLAEKYYPKAAPKESTAPHTLLFLQPTTFPNENFTENSIKISRVKRPWYFRWYTIAGGALIIAAGVTLPLVIHEKKYVEMPVQWATGSTP